MPLKLNTASGGSVSIEPTNTASNYTLTVPAQTGTVVAADSSGNVGVGTSSPQGKLDVSSNSSGVTAGDLVVDTTNKVVYVGRLSSTSGDNAKLVVRNRVGDALTITGDTTAAGTGLFRPGTNLLGFTTNGSERMRILSDGNLLFAKTADAIGTPGIAMYTNGTLFVTRTHPDAGGAPLYVNRLNVNGPAIYFYKDSTDVGNISVTGSTTSYNTSSDYRLKENIAPMTGALNTVTQLKPVTYNWKVDGSQGQGFIAHELQAVVPDCVTGEKDAVETYVDEEGVEQTRPVYQGIDTSFLVATLTAAIQELKAVVDAQALKIQALENK